MSTNFLFSKVCWLRPAMFCLKKKQTFPPIIWIFSEGEGDGIKSRHTFKNLFYIILTIVYIACSSILTFCLWACNWHSWWREWCPWTAIVVIPIWGSDIKWTCCSLSNSLNSNEITSPVLNSSYHPIRKIIGIPNCLTCIDPTWVSIDDSRFLVITSPCRLVGQYSSRQTYGHGLAGTLWNASYVIMLK